MTALSSAMRGLGASLQASLIRTEEIDHALTKGEVREEDVAAALRPHVPRALDISSGVVVNDAGEDSGQQDVLIVDSDISPPFLTAGRLGVHPIESVRAAIEVKSRVDGRDVAAAVSHLADVKRLTGPVPQPYTNNELAGQSVRERTRIGEPGDVRDKPFTGLVALATDTSATTLVDAYVNACLELEEIDRPTAFLVLNNFVVLWSPRDDGEVLQAYPGEAVGAVQMNVAQDSFLFFYAALFDALSYYVAPDFVLRNYVAAAGIIPSGTRTVRSLR